MNNLGVCVTLQINSVLQVNLENKICTMYDDEYKQKENKQTSHKSYLTSATTNYN